MLSDQTLTKTNKARTLELKDNQWLLAEEMVTSLKPLKVSFLNFIYLILLHFISSLSNSSISKYVYRRRHGKKTEPEKHCDFRKLSC